jgi:hypothetical protein
MTIRRNKILTYIAVILVIALVCFRSSFVAQAQTDTAFTSTDKFDIPTYNSTISFAVNGTFAKASLENGTYTFTGLWLRNLPRQEKQNLTVYAQDSNVTITSFQKSNTTAGVARLRYVVLGQGKQTFNLGVLPQDGEWSVTFNGVYMTENGAWDISPTGAVTVEGAASLTNVIITCYGFPASLREGSNQPFYQQHSVAIVTAIAVVIAVILAVGIRIKRKEHLD